MYNIDKHDNNYEIRVTPSTDGDHVSITIDGETQEAEGFEFSAPVGTSLAV